MNFDNLKELLERFCQIAQKNPGQITLEEFAQKLGLTVSKPLEEMFNLYDRVTLSDNCIKRKRKKQK